MEAYAISQTNAFANSEAQFQELKGRLKSTEAAAMTHAELENMIEAEGRELLRRLLQDHLTLRAQQERDLGLTGPVIGSDGVSRTHSRPSGRGLESLFGTVHVERVAYGGRRVHSLHPLDAALNLTDDIYSFGVRRRVADEISKNSFDETVSTVESTTGAVIPKRQAEELTLRAAADFDAFYETRSSVSLEQASQTGSLLVVSVDGKGVVMRKEDLRDATRKAAEGRRHKIEKRQSKGEKSNSRRMATVATVYTIPLFRRTPEEIVGELKGVEEVSRKARRPRPENKRVWASVVKEPEEVIAEAFREATSRDPEGDKLWVALVDGNPTQIKLLQKQAAKTKVILILVLDVIHVLEYLWKAALVFCTEGSPEAEAWVSKRFLRILQGRASHVAAGIRRSATRRGLSAKDRRPADVCARYLLKYRRFLHYDRYLAMGLPIATGVIEGACRHLVKDRMDLTGARWGLRGAESVLRLRSLRASGDFEVYWGFHQQQEFQRNHLRHFAGPVPRLCLPPKKNTCRPQLRLVK